MSEARKRIEDVPFASEATYKKVEKEVFEKIWSGEKAVTLVSLPVHNRSSLIKQMIRHPEFVDEDFGEKSRDYGFVVVDLPSDETVVEDMKEWLGEEFPKIREMIEAREMAETVLRKKKKLVFVVNSLDTMGPEPERMSRWKQLLKLYYQIPEGVSFIFGQGRERAAGAKDLLRELYPIAVKNRSYLPLYSAEDREKFVGVRREVFGNMLENGEEERMGELSGGYVPLMITLTEHRSLLEDGVKEILKDEEVRYYLGVLWESLEEESQGQFLEYVRGRKPGWSEYVLETGMVAGKGFFSPLWDEWIREVVKKHKVEIVEREGELELAGGVRLDSALSYQEYDVLKKLWKERGKVVERSEVARVMWGEKVEENYSDWAIDQVVSKIRRKIGDIGEKRLIETVKGKGFRVQG